MYCVYRGEVYIYLNHLRIIAHVYKFAQYNLFINYSDSNRTAYEIHID